MQYNFIGTNSHVLSIIRIVTINYINVRWITTDSLSFASEEKTVSLEVLRFPNVKIRPVGISQSD